MGLALTYGRVKKLQLINFPRLVYQELARVTENLAWMLEYHRRESRRPLLTPAEHDKSWQYCFPQ